MKICTQDKIDLLTVHKFNLSQAKTFEEYRDAHVSYIDMLIGQLGAEKEWLASTEAFIKDSQ